MNQSSSAQLMFTGASAGVNLEPYAALVRSPSSVGESDNSDFEFDFSEVHSGEPPVSPKFLNFSTNWESAMLSTTHSSVQHIYMAAPNAHYLHVVEVPQLQDVDGNVVGADTTRSLHNYHGDENSDANEQKQNMRQNLRSLMLERREVEQLPPIVSHHRFKSAFTRNLHADGASLRSSSSGGSSPDGAFSVSDSPFVSSDSPSSASSPQDRKKKSNRSIWSNLKLDFLHTKKLAGAKPSKAPVDSPHHVLRLTSNDTPAVMCSTDNYHDAAEINHHNYHNAKGAQSPARHSTCSSCRSSMSSSGNVLRRREKDMEGGLPRSKCASAPASPAASPSRAFSPAAAKGSDANAHWPAAQGVKRPMSPHAQHYQQQRARAEELRRRTFLPYRQTLFGACFLLSTRPQVAY